MEEFSFFESIKGITMNKKEDDLSHLFDLSHLDTLVDASVEEERPFTLSKFTSIVAIYSRLAAYSPFFRSSNFRQTVERRGAH